MEGVTAAVEHLLQGVSLEVVGRPGSGRSRLLDAVAQSLRNHDVNPVRVHGVGAMSGRALASLMASVPDLGRHPTIGEAVAFLARKATAKGIVLVDDADDLDDVSAGVLAAVRTRTSAPFLVVRRMGSRPAPLRSLLASIQPSMRHEVRPLAFGALRDVVEADVGSRVDAGTMARIATMSGRLPGLARAIALGDRRGGTMRAGGYADDAPADPGELGQTIESLLVDASDDDIDALTLFAVAGQVSLRDAHALIPASRIERLNEIGLIDFIDGPSGGTVGLYPPVVGEYLRAECTATRRSAIYDKLRSLQLTVPGERAGRNHVRVGADSAVVSRTMAAHWTAVAHERLARWRAKPVTATAVPLMMALLVADETVVDPGTVFATTEQGGPPEADAELAAWYAIHRAVTTGDRDAAGQILAEAERRAPQVRVRLRAVGRYLDLVLDRVPAADGRLVSSAGAVGAQGAADPGELDGAADAVHSVDVAIDIARGDTTSALARIDGHHLDSELFAHHGDVCRCLALILGGDVHEGARAARAGFAAAQRDWDPVGFQAYGYALALALVVQGRIVEFDDVVSHVMTMTSAAPLQAQYRAGASGLTAARSRWFGRPRRAVGSVLRTTQDTDRFGPLPFTVVPAGVTSTGTQQWDALEQTAARGYTAAAVFAAVEAVEREPDADRFARIEPTLAAVRSTFLVQLLDLARAMVRRDDGLLEDLVEQFAQRDAWLYAARAGIASVLVRRAAGDPVGAARAAGATWARVVPEARGVAGLFTRIADAVDLSPRENQIAELVSLGRSTSEIAHALVLSARTIEHHLLNTYRKAGVDSRDALRAAYGTWLRPVHTYGAWS